jgi:mannose-6-phosphate isomerase-like protein (cupin superfamily)
MAKHIQTPTQVKSAGNKFKLIEEFVGLVNSGNSDLSIAKMKSPSGWEEPPQTPQFDEYTFVLKGSMHVKTKDNTYIINENEVFIANKGETIQYSTPGEEGCEYIAVCMPAFSPDTVHRKEQK